MARIFQSASAHGHEGSRSGQSAEIGGTNEDARIIPGHQRGLVTKFGKSGPRTWRLRRQQGSPKWGGTAAEGRRPPILGGAAEGRPALVGAGGARSGGSGGREPPRKASPQKLSYLAVLVPPWYNARDVSVTGAASHEGQPVIPGHQPKCVTNFWMPAFLGGSRTPDPPRGGGGGAGRG